MAPKPKQKSKDNDDFVLTLSDEDVVPSDRELSADSSRASKQSAKRKHEDTELANGNAKKERTKKLKRQSKKKGEKENQQTIEEEDMVGSKDEYEQDDETLNPDFEFDIGGNANQGIDEFAGWGLDKKEIPKRGKKAVDIDEIISRRQQRKKDISDKKNRKQKNSEVENEVSLEEEGQDILNFEDDELVAPDGFGMGAGSEESSSEHESGANGLSRSEENQDDSDQDEGDTSESDGVASVVAHPLDAQSDSESSDEDAEEAQKEKEFFAPEERTETSKNAYSSFQSFSLSRPIIRGLTSVGFTAPTPIQSQTIPVALLGKDIVGGAVTGSGKTAAFMIPILERLLYRPRKVPTSRVAILMPTRELAVQCYSVGLKLATFTDITFCQLVGGFSLREQENILKKRPDVIIATPGRFIDHMRNSASFTVDTLEILVLDEADRMLEDGFADELNEILKTIPHTRQTMLFSATMTSSVDKLIRVGLNRPVRLMVDAKKQTVGTLVQEFVRLRPGREDKRLGYLLLLCKTVYKNRVIIFFRQKKEAHRVRIVFGLSGLKAAELHGSMTQEQRIQSIENFRDGKSSFLLATDVASRGLDIKGVETVINYEAPQSHEIYLHRVGRTARAGRSGRACTIAAEADRKVVKAAVKGGRAQGAKIVSRTIDPSEADAAAAAVAEMGPEIDEILAEEKEEKQLAQAEMEVSRGQNLIIHEQEIMSRPKRTWFASGAEKEQSKAAARAELNGVESLGKKERRKLSNKDKKKLDDSRARKEGKVWKKGKTARETKAISQGKEPPTGRKTKKAKNKKVKDTKAK